MSAEIKPIILSLAEAVRAYGENTVVDALNRFECEKDDDVTSFLRNSAIAFEEDNTCRTYVVIDDFKLSFGIFEVIAYFAISMTAILQEEDGSFIPAYLLAQIARSDAYTHDDYDGTLLLRQAEELIAEASDLVGGGLIFLDCKNEKLVKRYESFGFQRYIQDGEYWTLAKNIPG